jgi:hypothetical protein
MTKDDIIRMAREAGFTVSKNDSVHLFILTKFAFLVAAAEREACAKFVEDGYVRQFEQPWREDLAAAIRARGEKK